MLKQNLKYLMLLIMVILLVNIISAGDLRINRIEIPSEVEVDSTFESFVEIEGVDWKGDALLKVSSISMAAYPSSTNILVDGIEIVKLSIKAPANEQINYLTVEVCSGSQFGGKICDKKEVSVRTIKNNSKGSSNFLIGWILAFIFLIILLVGLYLIFRRKGK